jgi:hypothetical protein
MAVFIISKMIWKCYELVFVIKIVERMEVVGVDFLRDKIHQAGSVWVGVMVTTRSEYAHCGE